MGPDGVVERVFRHSRFLFMGAVLATSLAAVLLYAAALIVLLSVVLNFLQNLPSTADQGKALAVNLLKLLDLLLMSITFQIVAVALYRIFVTPDQLEQSKFLVMLGIKGFNDLKITVIQVAVMIMVILFIEQAVQLGATLETLYLGGAIALVMAASTFAWKNME